MCAGKIIQLSCSFLLTLGRKGGLVGGKRRLVTMTPAQRKKAAAKAARVRWEKKS